MDEFSFTEKEKAEGNYHKNRFQNRFRKTLVKAKCIKFRIEIPDEPKPTGSGIIAPIIDLKIIIFMIYFFYQL